MCVGAGLDTNATVMCLLMTLGLCQEHCNINILGLDIPITMNLGLSSLEASGWEIKIELLLKIYLTIRLHRYQRVLKIWKDMTGFGNC